MDKALSVALLIASMSLMPAAPAHGDASAYSYQERADFASGLEETLGHFWALELNLDEGNAQLAAAHALHPIAELYDAMKPTLKSSDPDLDARVQEILTNLKDRASTDVSRAQAQQAIEDAKDVVEIARSTVVGDELSRDTSFKAGLMKALLETSVAEYGEAVSDGMIEEMAEFQDGSAFVLRSQQIFETIRSDIDGHEAEEIDSFYEDLWEAYDRRADPGDVGTIAGGITHELDEMLGVEGGGETDLLEYVDNIRDLLEQAKEEYGRGNNDVALSLATKAYLDNYEFLEGPLIELDQMDMMERVEVMLREDLRNMIKNGESTSAVNAQADAILEEMDTIAAVVPEFGTIAAMILVVAVISVIAMTTKSRMVLRTR